MADTPTPAPSAPLTLAQRQALVTDPNFTFFCSSAALQAASNLTDPGAPALPADASTLQGLKAARRATLEIKDDVVNNSQDWGRRLAPVLAGNAQFIAAFDPNAPDGSLAKATEIVAAVFTTRITKAGVQAAN
jgi:hypothetical protein